MALVSGYFHKETREYHLLGNITGKILEPPAYISNSCSLDDFILTIVINTSCSTNYTLQISE